MTISALFIPAGARLRSPVSARVWPHLALGTVIVLSMWQWLPAGLPQPGDAFLAIAFVFAVVASRRIPAATDLYITLGVFVVWVAIINTAWAVIYPADDFMLGTLFYLFNAIVMLFIVALGCQDWQQLRAVVRYACAAALALQAAYIATHPPVLDADGIRAVGTFHNPNQLGYWALLLMAMIAVAMERSRLRLLEVAALACGYYALLMSLSKAAIAGGALLLALVLACCGLSRRLMIGAALVLLFVAAWTIGTGAPIGERLARLDLVERIEHRFTSMGSQSDDDVMSRGYHRVLAYPEHLLFGAGEGGFQRFRDDQGVYEIHSTFANVLFSYGVVGSVLFGALLLAVFRRAPWAHVLYFAPIALYGLTHMGLRFSEFWLFLGLVYAQAHYSKELGKK